MHVVMKSNVYEYSLEKGLIEKNKSFFRLYEIKSFKDFLKFY